MAIKFKPQLWLCKLCKEVYLAKSGVSLYCYNCKLLKRKEWRWRYKHSPAGIASRKKQDRTEKAKKRYAKYRATKKYKEYSNKRYKEMDANKRKARYFVLNAIRDGKLVRPKHCEICRRADWGEKRTMIEAHHYKGYEPECWLIVQWLCTDCHKEADAK